MDYIEFDVRQTGDGELVVWHDERLPSGRRLSEVSLEWYKIEVGGLGCTVAEMVAMIDEATGLHVDLKEVGCEVQLLDVLRHGRPAGNWVITSTEPESIRFIKSVAPDVRCGLSLGRQLRGRRHALGIWVRLNELFPGRGLRDCPADFLAVHRHLARVAVLRYCRRHQLPAWVWTVDGARLMNGMMLSP